MPNKATEGGDEGARNELMVNIVVGRRCLWKRKQPEQYHSLTSRSTEPEDYLWEQEKETRRKDKEY
ncbi:hypothetical protein CPB84DRAFT_1759258 [Gymnopilus junonius]|uniref:Uncharacterized protein n=1 Tax=Gymnopilus junonius TaxID=109634 RepID=A0A9P5P2Y1_GYMJU|nr:hypothetical protein CPB84DRAFT_1759258 [Gymnopilus junonius]